MSVFVTILLSIAGLVALILIIALFSKKGYNIERQITINRPVSVVFDYLRHLKNQDLFSKWVMTDPNMKKKFTGEDGSLGFIYAWDGNSKAGKGEQEIVGLTENKRIDVEVRFERPFKAVAKTPFTLEELPGNQTQVKWGMVSQMNYPMNAIMLFMNMEKLLGKDVDISLNKLKTILEK